MHPDRGCRRVRSKFIFEHACMNCDMLLKISEIIERPYPFGIKIMKELTL